MPFDPLSIAGAIGTTAGLLSFIVSTIEKLGEKKREILECQRRLRWYLCEVETCESEIKSWTRIWCNAGKPFPETVYAEFWGHKGLRAMEDRFENIIEEDSKIRRLLCEPNNDEESSLHLPTKQNRKDWNLLLKNEPHKTDPQRLQQDSPSWIAKIGFALYRSQDLKDRISRLEKMVSDLDKFSRLKWWEMQGRTDLGLVPHDKLQRIAQLRTGADKLTAFMKALDEAYRPLRHVWGFVLLLPKEHAYSELLASTPDFDIQFLVERVVLDELWAAHTVELKYSSSTSKWSVKDLQEHLDKLGQNPQLSRPLPLGIIKQPLRRHLNPSLSSSTDIANVSIANEAAFTIHSSQKVDPLTQSGNPVTFSHHHPRLKWEEVDRARTALGLAGWALVIGQTPWMSDLCSCGIHYAVFERSRRSSVLQSRRLNHAGPPCRGKDLQHRRMLLLGVTLAELALASPIEIQLHDHDDISFVVEGHVITLQELLTRVVRASRSNKYKRAVRSCFEIELDLRTKENAITGVVLDQYIENILTLIESYYNAVKENRKVQEPRAWLRRIAATYQQEYNAYESTSDEDYMEYTHEHANRGHETSSAGSVDIITQTSHSTFSIQASRAPHVLTSTRAHRCHNRSTAT